MIVEGGASSTLILFFLTILLLYYWGIRKPKGYPPGPKWLPILGSALEVSRLRKETGYFSASCNKLSEKYGSIIGLKIGFDLIVIINDCESMKAMINNEQCDGRPIGPVYDSRTFGKRRGIITVDGHLWIEQRRFITRHLRDLGFGRTDMDQQIQSEAEQLVRHYMDLINQNTGNTRIPDMHEDKEDKRKRNLNHIYRVDNDNNLEKDLSIEKEELINQSHSDDNFYVKVDADLEIKEASGQAGVIIEMMDIFSAPVLNTLWFMMSGKRFNIDDKELIYLQKMLSSLFIDVDMFGAPFNHFPFLKYIAPEMSGYKKFVETHQLFWQFLKMEVENHKKTFDPAAPQDLMDLYLQVLQSDNVNDTFSELQLMAICLDMFMAGLETTSKALSFGFLYLVLNPEVQRKAQREIDLVIGYERLPSINDRPRLSYVNAVVLESIRMFMGRTMNVPHRALKDTYIMGYRIPKDSMIVVNFNNILMGKFWDDPEEFRPDRFIDESGKIIMPDQFLPFGTGKRRCLGEVLAKNNIFLITAALLQNFTFAPVPGEEPPRNEYTEGVTASPKPFRVFMTKRT